MFFSQKTHYSDHCSVSNEPDEALLGEETIPRRPSKRSPQYFPTRLFWIVLFCLQITILWLLLYRHPTITAPKIAVAGDINGIIPEFSTMEIKFGYETSSFVPGPNDSAVTAAIWDNWTSLIPIGNGVINIENYEDYPHLTTPIVMKGDKLREGTARFSTAWVHQLHCLYFVMKEYHRVLHHGPDGTEYYIDPTHNSYHASHCFNYLRQSILCYADSTLEGSGEGSGSPDGSGQTHVCKNRQESMEWLKARRYDNTHAIDDYEIPLGAHRGS